MAKGINKVILIGNLGADPEIRYLPNSGTPVATLRLATSEVWRDKQSGENQEKTEWHRVVLFNRLAEIANEYLRKGTKVFIEGKLRTSKWQDSNGQDRYTTEIVANEMQMLDSRGGAGSSNKSGADGFAMDDFAAAASTDFMPSYPGNNSGEGRGNKSRSTSAETSVDFNDDIPF